MNLVAFSSQYLRVGEPLPFGLRDAAGRLLLSASQAIASDEQLKELVAQTLFCDEQESTEWRRKLNATVDGLIRQNAAMKTIADARVDGQGKEQAASRAEPTLIEGWTALAFMLDGALRDPRPQGDWVAKVLAVHERARKLAARRTDASLYHLIYSAGHSTEKYSANHGLLTLVVCELAGTMLGWEQSRIDSLGRAALTMNVAMTRLQDQLASSDLTPSPRMRDEIKAHPMLGARLLEEGGVADTAWRDAVRWHHDGQDAAEPMAALSPERQLARLLRRVDVFTAKLSRRRVRVPMSPVQAARDACLGPGGKPDEIGAALLKAVGLYPPGSFVELANNELGIVLARGARANVAFVATLVSASGNVVAEPSVRDTSDAKFAVKQAVASAKVRVLPPHERLLSLR